MHTTVSLHQKDDWYSSFSDLLSHLHRQLQQSHKESGSHGTSEMLTKFFRQANIAKHCSTVCYCCISNAREHFSLLLYVNSQIF